MRLTKVPALLAIVALLAAPVVLEAQSKCGVLRWPVKIAEDRDAGAIDTVPIRTTVAELRRLPRPAGPFPHSNRVGPVELRTYVLRARFARARDQDDSDIHLLLRDLEVEDATLVAEIPSPECVTNPRHKVLFEEVRRALRGVPRDGVVEIVGVGFFDTDHGQSGMAENGIEIHPVFSLRVIGPSRPAGLLSPMPLSAQRDSARADSSSLALADSVWINPRSNVYHCRGTQWYGRTVRGRFAPEREALAAGARPAGGRRCSI